MIAVRFCLSALLLLSGLARMQGQQVTPVRPPERQAILDALKKAPAFVRETAGKKKVVLCSVLRFETMPKTENVVEALHFRYDDGMTLRTRYSPAEKKVLEVEALPAYPTPLAPEEVRVAEELAVTKDAAFTTFLIEQQGLVEIEVVAPVVAEQASKLYGKRLAVLVARPWTGSAVSVTVNLTDRTVWRD